MAATLEAMGWPGPMAERPHASPLRGSLFLGPQYDSWVARVHTCLLGQLKRLEPGFVPTAVMFVWDGGPLGEILDEIRSHIGVIVYVGAFVCASRFVYPHHGTCIADTIKEDTASRKLALHVRLASWVEHGLWALVHQAVLQAPPLSVPSFELFQGSGPSGCDSKRGMACKG